MQWHAVHGSAIACILHKSYAVQCTLDQQPLQAIGCVTRYMTHAHRRTFIEASLAKIAADKLATQDEQPILTQDVVQAQLQGLFGSGRAFFLLQHKQHMQSMLDRVQELGV